MHNHVIEQTRARVSNYLSKTIFYPIFRINLSIERIRVKYCCVASKSHSDIREKKKRANLKRPKFRAENDENGTNFERENEMAMEGSAG